MNTLTPGAPLRSLSPTSIEYQRAQGASRAAKPARAARFTLDAPEHSGTIPGAIGDILPPGVALTSSLAVIFTLNQYTRASTASRASFRNSSTRGLLRNLSDEAFARTFVPSSMTRSSVINPSALRSPKVCTNNSCKGLRMGHPKVRQRVRADALHSGEPLIRRMMFAQPLNRTGRTHGLTVAVDPQAHQ